MIRYYRVTARTKDGTKLRAVERGGTREVAKRQAFGDWKRAGHDIDLDSFVVSSVKANRCEKCGLFVVIGEENDKAAHPCSKSPGDALGNLLERSFGVDDAIKAHTTERMVMGFHMLAAGEQPPPVAGDYWRNNEIPGRYDETKGAGKIVSDKSLPASQRGTRMVVVISVGASDVVVENVTPGHRRMRTTVRLAAFSDGTAKGYTFLARDFVGACIAARKLPGFAAVKWPDVADLVPSTKPKVSVSVTVEIDGVDARTFSSDELDAGEDPLDVLDWARDWAKETTEAQS